MDSVAREASAASRPGLLRARDPHAHARVTYLELFFDLVFVFAITQLSHALLHDLSLEGVARTGALFLAVWWVWIYTTWATNFLDPDRLPIRALLFAMMFAGLVLSMAVPDAFGSTGLHVALAIVALQVGRGFFMVQAIGARDAALRRNFLRVAIWLAAAAPFWIAGGLAGPEPRLWLWAIALAIEYASPAAYFWVPGLGRSTSADWRVEPGHFAERCGLFVIIALGESILVTGATFAKLPWTAASTAAFLVAFVGSVALWWVYFHLGSERGAEHMAGSGDPGRVARLGYTYLHLPIVAGIVVAAVGDELLLQHPETIGDRAAIACLLGGPALFLVGLLAFKRLSAPRTPLSHLVGLALLAAAVPIAPALSALALGALATAVLVLVAVWEHHSLRGTEA